MSRCHRLITTPIFYASGRPHLGHAFSVVLADSLARFESLVAPPSSLVKLSTGTDEHGRKIELAAGSGSGCKSSDLSERSPVEPGLLTSGPDTTSSTRRFVDSVSAEFRETFDLLHVGNSNGGAKGPVGRAQYDFVRTTELRHQSVVRQLWTRLRDRGFIEPGQYSGWYSVSDEEFLMENEVVPVDGGGSLAEPGRQQPPRFKSIHSNHPVVRLTEQNYKFPLEQFRSQIYEWLTSGGSAGGPVVPESRLRQAVQMVSPSRSSAPLPSLSVSRPASRCSWGIPVPGDPDQVIYVWLDALANYLTVSGMTSDGEPVDDRHQSCSGLEQLVGPFWPAHWQVLGKDILKFHAVYWPAFLLAADLPLPRRLLVHAHFRADDGSKMSKSLGNVPRPMPDLVADYGVDAVRYFLLRQGGLDSDSGFCERRLVEMTNQQLGDNLGNLLARVTAPQFLGPDRMLPASSRADASAANSALGEAVARLPAVVRAAVDDRGDVGAGLEAIMSMLRLANAQWTSDAPWRTDLSPILRQQSVFVASEALRVAGILLQPAVPSTASLLLDRLGVAQADRTWSHAECNWFANTGSIYPGRRVQGPDQSFKLFCKHKI